MVLMGDGELGSDSREGAWEMITTSKVTGMQITQSWHGGGSDNK